MKAYTIQRPNHLTYVQWDETNVAEFESMGMSDWSWISMTGVPTYVVDGTDLQVWLGESLWKTIPSGHWFNGSVYESMDDVPGNESVISGVPPFNYVVSS